MSIYAPDVLAGKRILITGGGTGLGRGVAARLVAHGAQVHIWGRREKVLAEAVVEISAGHAGAAHHQSVNVRDFEAVSAAVAHIWAEYGPLTGVLNNAAANFIAPTATLSPRAFEAVTSTVMTGSFNTTLAVGKRWIAEGLKGSVLSNLTTWVWSGSAFVVPSARAKAAVHAMTMSLAVEWGRYGIRLNALAPGPIPTEYAWEMLNPVSMLHRGLIFGMGLAWAVILAIFLFDLFVMRQGWCGHFCPVGAFYSLIGKLSLTRIRLPNREACNDCMDCFAVCPEQQVIRPALKAINGTGPVILESNCTNCGRCIDVCSKDVFRFGLRTGGSDSNLGGVAGATPK